MENGDTPSRDVEDLQFDRAESTDAEEQKETNCDSCGNSIEDQYYEAGGMALCTACKDQLDDDLTAGSGAGRFLRATAYGLPAAGLGTGVYYAIAAVTGYEFGLVAIIIGLMVGAAVRAGAHRRGGWVYQGLAVTLTYFSIVATYIPSIVEELSGLDPIPSEAPSVRDDGTVEETGEVGAEQRQQTGTEQEGIGDGEDTEELTGFLGFVVGVIIIMAVACAAPFLMSFDNILGLIIIGIGLYEAWKLNKRNEVTISGPYALKSGTDG